MKVRIGKTVQVSGQSDWTDFTAVIDSEGQLVLTTDGDDHIIGVDTESVVSFIEALNELIASES